MELEYFQRSRAEFLLSAPVISDNQPQQQVPSLLH